MDILFARHGNTFGPGDKVVWVGRETDLPLVEKGHQQARAFGEAMLRLKFRPDHILCASLKRTRAFAADVVQVLGDPAPQPVVDNRLDEIHYGRWAGLTSEEIGAASKDAAAQLEAWSAHDVWPTEAGWETTQAQLQAALAGFVQDLVSGAGTTGQRLLVVSSNGILRFLPRVLGAAPADGPSLVMKTGHAGRITGHPGAFRMVFWNQPPEAL